MSYLQVLLEQIEAAKTKLSGDLVAAEAMINEKLAQVSQCDEMCARGIPPSGGTHPASV